jgi:hypothetical protein
MLHTAISAPTLRESLLVVIADAAKVLWCGPSMRDEELRMPVIITLSKSGSMTLLVTNHMAPLPTSVVCHRPSEERKGDSKIVDRFLESSFELTLTLHEEAEVF